MRDLVRDQSTIILILGRFGIPLGFGDKSIAEVCTAHHVDEETFLQVVNYCTGRDYHYERISLTALIEYLRQAHEYYLEFNLPQIRRKLIEALDCSGTNDIALLIIKFYDEYVREVRKHMENENKTVFAYVQQLQQGYLKREYSIATFQGKHTPMADKLKELKEVIIQYYPEKNNFLLNEVLLNIMLCEEDLTQHCDVEDHIFVPAVKLAEQRLLQSNTAVYTDAPKQVEVKGKNLGKLGEREKDVLVCVARGMSNKETANALCLSVHTVTTHRRNISQKLQIHSTAGLIIYAIANGLIQLDEVKG
ncbi:MAG: helix-turn-helix transcriptional regulator [Bacteroidaceae bacterium]|nr:helix-turn-helix transcriptional regulator [Bacteroidaceae bacterium]MBQ2366284.1 helix-turn-helix transcriptional regulator [Bacteroidaceae bacterium]